MRFKKGTRVRFVDYSAYTEGNKQLVLGASRRDELYGCVDETFTTGDVGVVAFPHPNKDLMSDWFYVEVASKKNPGEKLYVGAVGSMVEVIK